MDHCQRLRTSSSDAGGLNYGSRGVLLLLTGWRYSVAAVTWRRDQDIDENDLADGEPECRVTELIDASPQRCAPQRWIKIFDNRSHRSQPQPTISLPAKNCAISVTAVSGASEPCTEFSPIDLACTLRMVPGVALAGSVAPMMSRYAATALSPSSTCTTTGPEVMNATSSPKNGRWR